MKRPITNKNHDITSADKAIEMAQSTAEKLEAGNSEYQKAFSNLISSLEGIGLGQISGLEEISVLYTLPDEQFSILAPIFLEELEKAYNNVNDRLMMAQALNASGLKIDDLINAYSKICEELDSLVGSGIPAARIDFLKRLMALTYNAISSTEGIASKKMLIPIELCRPEAKIPTYAHETDAGMDIYAVEDVTINPGETKLLPTGLKVAIPEGYELQIRPKSGRSLKSKLRVANTPATIDSGYRDEIGIILENIEPFVKSANIDENGRLYEVEFGSSYTIEKGEKVAQLVLSEVPKAVFYPVNNITEISGNRNGGFGSTGIK